MYESEYRDNRMDATGSRQIHERRNGTERRKERADGFAFISTVGWICRREQFRREEDPNLFAKSEFP
jgi:hypothetical protein